MYLSKQILAVYVSIPYLIFGMENSARELDSEREKTITAHIAAIKEDGLFEVVARSPIPADISVDILKRLPITNKNSDLLLAWAEALKCDFTHEQLKQAGPLLADEIVREIKRSQLNDSFVATLSAPETSSEDMIINRVVSERRQAGKIRFKIATWFMLDKNSPLTEEARLKLGWLLALDEEKEERITAIIKQLTGAVNRHIPMPRLFLSYTKQPATNLRALYDWVKSVKNGAALPAVELYHDDDQLKELLEFSCISCESNNQSIVYTEEKI